MSETIKEVIDEYLEWKKEKSKLFREKLKPGEISEEDLRKTKAAREQERIKAQAALQEYEQGKSTFKYRLTKAIFLGNGLPEKYFNTQAALGLVKGSSILTIDDWIDFLKTHNVV